MALTRQKGGMQESLFCILVVISFFKSGLGYQKYVSNEELQQMVINKNGDIFLGAKNRLYKLSWPSSGAVLSNEETTGPVQDNVQCYPPPYNKNCANKKSTNNYNKILLFMGTDELQLITCGSVYQGICKLRSAADLSITQDILAKMVAANSMSASTVAFIAPGLYGNEVMYVAATATDREKNIKNIVPAVCSRSLDSSSLLDISQEAEVKLADDTYLINYVYGFSSGTYSYFVTVQGKDQQETSYHSKIVRVCHLDKSYASYLEMPLECKKGDTLYNIVLDAHVGNPGEKLAISLGMSQTDDVLFATFAVSVGNTAQPSSQSALCVFSIKDLNSKFIQNIKNCNLVKQKKLGLPWLKNGDNECKLESGTVNDNFCSNALSANRPLGGELPSVASPVMTYSSATTLSVTSLVYKKKLAVFLGTKTGHLLKVAIDSHTTEVEPYEDITLANNSPIVQLALTPDKTNVYAMMEKEIYKVPTQECDKYSSCSECVSVGFPFCGWCTLYGSCSVIDKCPDKAEPRFISESTKCVNVSTLTPDAVPVTQQVDLKVKMDNLPIPKSGHEYKCYINDILVPTTYTQSSSLIECKTPSPSSLPPVTGKGAIWLSLSLFATETSVKFFTTKVPFYDCTTYDQCMPCAESRYPCGWCIYENKCTANVGLSSTCPSNNVPWVGNSPGNSLCPRILPVSPENIIPVGVNKAINVKASLLPATKAGHQYTCELTDDNGQVYSTPATWNSESSLTCQPRKYNYQSNVLQEIRAKLAVKWSNKVFIDNPNDFRVLLHKCFVASKDCSSCLIYDAKYKCGWCRSDKRCDVQENCPASWGNTVCREKPVISGFFPTSGPSRGGTVVNITGSELGIEFKDIENSVYIAGRKCIPDKNNFIPSKGFLCTTTAVPYQQPLKGFVSVDVHGITGKSEGYFSYRNPVITGFFPGYGPRSGGTEVKIEGKHIKTGLVIKASIGGEPCIIDKNSITNSSLVCSTHSKNARRRRRDVIPSTVEVSFDGHKVSGQSLFNYTDDPVIKEIVKQDDKLVAFPSGGYPLIVYGTNLDVVQKPIVRLNNPDDSSVFYKSPCQIISKTELLCSSPNVSSLGNIKDVEISFKMDGVKSVQNLTKNAQKYSRVELRPDPVILSLEKNVEIQDTTDQEVTLKGSNLLNLPPQYYEARIANVKCNITTLVETLLVFVIPYNDLPLEQDEYEIVIQVGLGSLAYKPGLVFWKKDVVDADNVMPIIYIVVGVAGLLLLMIIAGLLCLYCRKRAQQKRSKKTFEQQMTSLESRVAKECREAFAELQTDITDLTNELSASGIPYLDFRSYAIRVLFPGVEDHSILQEKSDRSAPHWETIHRQLMQLINNKHFLLVFVRTLEAQSNFSMKDRCYVASLLMVILQGRMEYATDILKQLLSELIRKSVSRSHPKLLLRRTESIAEKMLTNWLTFCMFNFIKGQAGEPLFLLFRAIKGQVEKGPIDCVTGDARYSLSEDKLLRQTIEYKQLVVTVESEDGPPVSVELLDTDTISQAKEKIIDVMYKNAPVSSQLCRDALDLEWHTGKDVVKCLKDDDTSSVVEGEWRRINTLKHYEVPHGARLKLVAHQSSFYTSGGFSRTDVNECFPSVVFSPRSYTPMLSQSAIDLVDEGVGKIWHLVKPSEHTNDKEDPRHSKMLSEIYLTRLLATKGTLQKFVDDLFESVFSVGRRGAISPIPIKFLFDFLDSQAKELNISDCEVLHTWKNNSLPLRFWINIIKNPNFVLDINKSNIVDSCLSVIAQLFMDSCSVAEQRLGKDSPSNKLLYAREIPSYRQRVQKFYADVHNLPPLSDGEVSNFFAELSMQYNGQFNAENAVKDMFSFMKKYQDQIQDSLVDAGQTSLATKLEHIIATATDSL